MIELRQYQRDALSGIYGFFESGDEGNPLVVCPTGSGKSVIIAMFCKEAIEAYPTTRVLILSHRKEILEQNANKILKVWNEAPIGIYSAGLRSRRVRQITVAGIQSVFKKAILLGAFDLILIDEAHLISTHDNSMYQTFLKDARKLNPYLKIIGLTATPFRLDSGILFGQENSLFDSIAYDIKMPRLINEGWLSPLVSKSSLTQADLSEVQKRGGEYVPGQAEKALDVEALTQAAIEEMKRFASDRKSWLIFCTGVDHVLHVTKSLNAAGIQSEFVTGETLAIERATTLAKFCRQQIRALVNCEVLTTGFDAPCVDMIALLRPTCSPGLYCQMLGRGSRLSPGKTNCLILDFAGNIEKHGPVDAIEIKTKFGGKSEISCAPVKICLECRLSVPIQTRVCPECGFQFPFEEKPKHQEEASYGDVLSSATAEIKVFKVERVDYCRHEKQGKPPSMRVDYFARSNDLMPICSEWVCFEHEGFAAQKAAAWWTERAAPWALDVPLSVNEAVEQAPSDISEPTTIAVRREGKYFRLLRAYFTERDISQLDPSEIKEWELPF